MADRDSTTDPPTARTRRWRRRVGVVVGCLLAGTIINVLVAWGCAAWATQQAYSGTERLKPPTTWPSSYLDEIGWPPPNAAERYLLLDGVGATVIDITGGDPEAGWQRTDPPDKVWVSLEVRQFGLPFRALQWETHGVRAGPRGMEIAKEANDAAGLRTGLDISKPLTGEMRRLPLVPIPFGFVTNLILIALLLYSPFWLRTAIRSVVRSRRGLCQFCAYDLRGADHGKCPECGERVKGVAA